MARLTDEEKARARLARLARLRELGARLLGYDAGTFAAMPRWQRMALAEGRLAVDKPRMSARRLAHSLPDAETPAPEAAMHDRYAKMPMGIDRANVAYNLTSTPLRRANHAGAISKRQMDAGEAFERLHLIAYHVGGTRDPLDMTPRGGKGYISDSHAAAITRARSDLSAIEGKTGPVTYGRLVDICVHHEPIGRRNARYLGWVRLITGLDVVADHLGLPEEQD